MPFNVLISSAGRRVVLLRLFQEALKEMGLNGRVLAVDCSRTSPTFHIADRSFEVPRCTEDGFVDCMVSLCRREQVALIVPTIDTELPTYAENRELFASVGTTVGVSSPETVAIGRDKLRTNQWVKDEGFETVEQWYSEGETEDWPRFPVILKPRFGSASIGVQKAENPEELRFYLQRVDNPTVEEVAAGREYTVNMFVSREGRVLCAVPHQRIEVRAGEVSKGITRKDEGLLETARRLGQSLPGAFGALNFQCFLGDDGVFRIIEINARFGGGYPLAHKAGANFPRWLIEETLGLPSTARFDAWEDGLVMLRYDAAVFVRGQDIE